MGRAVAVPVEALVERFSEILERDGLHASLAFLNSRTRHRYTAAYRFDPPMLRNLALFDRENPSIRLGGDTPIHETYCSLVELNVAPFSTEDGPRDGRLADHPARRRVIAYYGVPMISADGGCFGSLCHFDDRPRIVPDEELPLLERAAAAVMRHVATASAGPRVLRGSSR